MKFLISTFLSFCSLFLFSQTNLGTFFEKTDRFMQQYVTAGKVNYQEIKNNQLQLDELTGFISEISSESLAGNEKKAYLINVYNIYVIQQVVSKYPTKSPMDISGFFESTKFNVGGKKYTLNHIENNILRKEFKDARLHFVLVCGALGCPVITNYAYTPENLEEQLEIQTKVALNNNSFVYSKSGTVYLSEIFKWYAVDFGSSNTSTIKFINKYRTSKFVWNAPVSHYSYDWTLNEFKGKMNEANVKTPELIEEKNSEVIELIEENQQKLNEPKDETVELQKKIDSLEQAILQMTENNNNQFEATEIKQTEETISDANTNVLLNIPETVNLQTYTAGTLLKLGQMDLTTFNTIYTQTKLNWLGSDFTGPRETFFTSSWQVLVGVSKNKRINAGVELNFRSSARSTDLRAGSTFDAFRFQNNDSSRVGLANVGLRLKVSPFKGVNDFTIQSTFYIPTTVNPEGFTNPDGTGNGNLYWSDWNRYTSWTQFFYTKTFRKFQIFTEADLLFRIRRNKQQITHLDIPLTAIFSYFPTSKITAYAIGQHTTRLTQNLRPNEATDWVVPMNFTTVGMGLKYQPKSNLIFELLYTKFIHGINSGLGNTFNLGVKFLTK